MMMMPTSAMTIPMMIITMNMLTMGRAQLSIKAGVVCGDSKARPREIKRDAHRVDLHKMPKHRNVTLVNILLTMKCKIVHSMGQISQIIMFRYSSPQFSTLH